ncbi:MAG TPA: CHASE domain-containing protein [Burkholderiales bacterium]|nr:CHASE domain-containing protein [Burkholderiales bacterium]
MNKNAQSTPWSVDPMTKKRAGPTWPLHSWAAWLVLVVALAATVFTWRILRNDYLDVVRVRFESRAAYTTTAIHRELAAGEQILRGAAGLFATTDNVSPNLWKDYVTQLRIEESLAGVNGLGFAPMIDASRRTRHVQSLRDGGLSNYAIWPAGDASSATPVSFVEPANARNLLTRGFDMASDPSLRNAIDRAKDSGEPALTAKFQSQQTSKGERQSEFLMYLPVYRGGLVPPTVETRRAAILGYVYLSIRASDFIGSVLARNPLGADLTVHTGDTPTDESILFQTNNVRPPSSEAAPSKFSKVETINFHGFPWTFAHTARESFSMDMSPDHSWIVLAIGVAISFFLFWAARWLVHSRTEAIALAGQLTTSMQQNEARLFGIIQSAMEVIITIDENQKIIIFNPMAEKVFRCSAMDAIGSPLLRFIPERYRNTHEAHVGRFGATGISERQMGQQRALYGLRADGEEFPIEASISQIRDGRGKLYTVMLRDITERKKAETELQASRNELAQLSASIQAGREEEKSHIARELHDDLGQRLTALKMDLSMLQSALPPEPTKLHDRTKAMHSLIDSTVTAVRRIAADLRPTMLDDLGLIPSIEWLASDFSTRYGVATHLELDHDELGFDNTATTAVFRMVQEALTNVARHAGASEVRISLVSNEGECVVRISDNGKGMPTENRKPASFGLLGMRERARLLGGEVTIHSQSGKGTTIEIHIALPPDE